MPLSPAKKRCLCLRKKKKRKILKKKKESNGEGKARRKTRAENCLSNNFSQGNRGLTGCGMLIRRVNDRETGKVPEKWKWRQMGLPPPPPRLGGRHLSGRGQSKKI